MASQDSDPTARQAALPSDVTPTIVIASADRHSRRAYASAFRDEGFAVEIATTEPHAVELALRMRPAAVIAEAALREGSGVSLCRTLIATPATARAAVILLAPDMSVAAEATSDVVLRKPCPSRTLVEAVRQLVADHAAERLLAATLPEEAQRLRRERSARRGDGYLSRAWRTASTDAAPVDVESEIVWQIGPVCCTKARVSRTAVRLTVWQGDPPAAIVSAIATIEKAAAAAERLRACALQLPAAVDPGATPARARDVR